ncbi:hypothetical protein GWI33_012864 [Rhynchophorus ferrugineus]|uniref:Uncharacterized protein n=1 Tax=Rhynchophorus ferrugineus TaxID=354439 RepID=A0A834IAV9_RHYFE|nr:hypothetical protein GWI33_012864 [Rhynchophorus ferrugineus]
MSTRSLFSASRLIKYSNSPLFKRTMSENHGGEPGGNLPFKKCIGSPNRMMFFSIIFFGTACSPEGPLPTSLGTTEMVEFPEVIYLSASITATSCPPISFCSLVPGWELHSSSSDINLSRVKSIKSTLKGCVVV